MADPDVDLMEFDNGDTMPPPSRVEVTKALFANANVPANRDIRNYYYVPESQAKPEIDPWTMKPEIPSTDEVMGSGPSRETDDGTAASLPKNKISGPWPSKEKYLETLYRLLREDAVAPLRNAVADFRSYPYMDDSPSVNIYENVHIIGITYSQRGVAFRIRFSTRRAGKNIIWDYSNRLKSGSIVALSPEEDYFKKKCVVAVIAARPLENVKKLPPEVDIFFAQPGEAEFDPHREWIMVEAKNGYYEASRHTMTALQKMSKESFPFAEHLCDLKTEIASPQYIADAPNLKVAPVISGTEDEEKLDVLCNWPKEPMADMDESQWRALEQIITKRLAIVQGPPGTGKTFVSVAALKILLANKDGADPPIIVAAQTNHALDQLLSHISNFETRFIRLGGRSHDLEIKRHTVYSVKRKEPPRAVSGGLLNPSLKKFHSLSYEILRLLQDFNADPRTETTILPMSFFVKHGVLSEAQAKSMEDGAKRTFGRPQCRDPIFIWLGDKVAEFRVNYNITERFCFREDEIDLEYEQLRELEAEQGIGIEDDELEALKGDYCVIQERYYGLQKAPWHQEPVDHYLQYDDFWKIPSSKRGAVYNILRQKVKDKITADLRKLMILDKLNCENMQIGKWEKDYLFLQNAKVIGMTTTGLNKYRGLLTSLKPRIVLIEEAAEVIEASVTAACFESLQHLILVGDHKQLKGSCAVKDLMGEPFYLDVSMFERLVRNKMPFITLQQQRRMPPEMRRLLEPIYGRLRDHPCVYNRPKVPGMGDVNLFFFTHDWPENSDSLISKLNEVEAQVVVEFFVYLVLNGVSPHNITVLTFYNGQRKKLLKLLREHPFLDEFYVKVVTVDSYQGEEDDIILLSLVRSSNTGNIGFLSTENRICVALSRAKQGLYIFGNAKCLAEANKLWSVVITMLKEGNTPAEKKLGSHIPLTCERHGRKTFVDVLNRLNGGCPQPCSRFRSCGHHCKANCHACSCDEFECYERCGKRMVCDHICEQVCTQDHTCRCKCPTFPANVNAEARTQRYKSLAHGVSTAVKEGMLLPDLYTSEDEKEHTPGTNPVSSQQDRISGVDKTSDQGQHEETAQKCNDSANYGIKEQDGSLPVDDEAENEGNQSTGYTEYGSGEPCYFCGEIHCRCCCPRCEREDCYLDCPPNPASDKEDIEEASNARMLAQEKTEHQGPQTEVLKTKGIPGSPEYDDSYDRGYCAGQFEGRETGFGEGFLHGFVDGFRVGLARRENEERAMKIEQNTESRTTCPVQVIETSNDKEEEPKQSEQPVSQPPSYDLIELDPWPTDNESGRPSAVPYVPIDPSTLPYPTDLLD
ncbi:Helicase [Aspergillus sclerotialis]|uniref:Helicase n=1 Tax=Aspergillus sclerotialis TaxID=2070753 RepID=A0A3A3A3Y7_9EURO|nr:Helicase [Aspergillus sclerotialis]